MLDHNTLSPELYNSDLPTPNVYFVTVNSVTKGQHHLYVAADYSGAALRKVQRHCREHLHFAAHRGNCDIKMRRFRLGDYLECPEGLQAAGEAAHLAHEWSTVRALEERGKQVQALLADLATAKHEGADQTISWDILDEQLATALKSA